MGKISILTKFRRHIVENVRTDYNFFLDFSGII